MLFIQDLMWDELEVLSSVLKRVSQWIAAEGERESNRLSGASEEIVEHVMTHPSSTLNLEEFTVRAVFNELNALCEFAVQDAWKHRSGDLALPDGTVVFAAGRGDIERELRERGLDVTEFARWTEIQNLKETSEGFKHRQRMLPFRKELLGRRYAHRARTISEDNTASFFEWYELSLDDARDAIAVTREFFNWLRSKDAL